MKKFESLACQNEVINLDDLLMKILSSYILEVSGRVGFGVMDYKTLYSATS